MATIASLAADEQRARDRLREVTAQLSSWMGQAPVRERASRDPLPSQKSVELVDHLATIAEAVATLTTELDVLRTARAATKGAR